MANLERGEVELKGSGETYTLKLTMSGSAKLQQKTKKPLGQLLRECGDINTETITIVLRMLLQKYHAEAFKTDAQVEDLIDDVGLQAISTAVGAVINRDDSVNGEGSANPQPSQTSGTSDGSTQTLVESA